MFLSESIECPRLLLMARITIFSMSFSFMMKDIESHIKPIEKTVVRMLA